jgi:hypothetical protein
VGVLVVGAPATMAANRHPVEQGWMPPPVMHRHRSCELLCYDGACLGLLLVVTPVSACCLVQGSISFECGGHRAAGAAPGSGKVAG